MLPTPVCTTRQLQPESQRGAEMSPSDSGQQKTAPRPLTLTSNVPHRLDPRPDKETEPAITEGSEKPHVPSSTFPSPFPSAALSWDWSGPVEQNPELEAAPACPPPRPVCPLPLPARSPDPSSLAQPWGCRGGGGLTGRWC